MPTTNVTLMCPVCRQPTLHTQEVVSAGVQVVLILLTVGIYLLVMLLSSKNKPQCTACATRAAQTAPGFVGALPSASVVGGTTGAAPAVPLVAGVRPTEMDMCVKCFRKTAHGVGPSGRVECLECIERKLGPVLTAEINAKAVAQLAGPAASVSAPGTHRMHCARCNRETVHDLVAGGVKCQRCAILDEDAAERGRTGAA